MPKNFSKLDLSSDLMKRWNVAGAYLISHRCLRSEIEIAKRRYMDVSKNRGTPKWMIYNGKPY